MDRINTYAATVRHAERTGREFHQRATRTWQDKRNTVTTRIMDAAGLDAARLRTIHSEVSAAIRRGDEVTAARCGSAAANIEHQIRGLARELDAVAA